MKKIAKKLVIFALFLSCLPLSAAPKLTLSKSFNIVAVNGSEYESGIFSQSKELTLNNGLNRVAIEYEEVFDGEDGDDFDVVKSGVFLLQLYAESNSQLTQSFIKPSDASAAKRYIKHPMFSIKKQSGESVEFNLSPMQSDKLSYILGKTKLRQNAAIDLSHPNRKKGKIPQSKELKQTKASVESSRALQMLEYWWSQASEADKKAFKETLKKQD